MMAKGQALKSTFRTYSMTMQRWKVDFFFFAKHVLTAHSQYKGWAVKDGRDSGRLITNTSLPYYLKGSWGRREGVNYV